jgi:hypothetical protein
MALKSRRVSRGDWLTTEGGTATTLTTLPGFKARPVELFTASFIVRTAVSSVRGIVAFVSRPPLQVRRQLVPHAAPEDFEIPVLGQPIERPQQPADASLLNRAYPEPSLAGIHDGPGVPPRLAPCGDNDQLRSGDAHVRAGDDAIRDLRPLERRALMAPDAGREIGIRIALGAGRADVVRVVMGYALRLLVTGLALGMTAAWAVTRGLQPQLSGVTVTDSATYATAVFVLSCAVLAACLLPLRRALRFDPVTLFRA